MGKRIWLSKQSPDSNVDIVVGYSPDADFWDDVCDNMATFPERLPETLDVEVDVIAVTQVTQENECFFRYIDMEAMLSAKTIWGDISWAEATRSTAMDLLQQGYARIKKTREIMSHVRRKLLSTKVSIVKVTSTAIINLLGRVNVSGVEGFRLSLLQDALPVIRLFKIPGDPFFLMNLSS